MAVLKLKSLSTLCLFVAGAALFGLLAPSLMGIAMLVAIVAIPLAILAGCGCVLCKSLFAGRRAAEAVPESER